MNTKGKEEKLGIKKKKRKDAYIRDKEEFSKVKKRFDRRSITMKFAASFHSCSRINSLYLFKNTGKNLFIPRPLSTSVWFLGTKVRLY